MDYSAMDESTDLRAEVPPFIPNRNTAETNNTCYQDGIPHYVTSCYPFVQDNGFRSMQFQHNPSQWNISGIRQWHTELNMYQSFGYQPNGISPPMLFPNQRYNNSGDIRFGRQVLDSQRNYEMFNNNHVAMSRYHQQPHNAHHQYRNHHQKKNYSKKIKRRNGGFQKEQPSPANNQAVSAQLKIDFSQQTDFPLGVAFLTCEESPSSLYNDKLAHTSHSASREEDVDSDSGYYSPKHGGECSQVKKVRSIGVQLERSYFQSCVRTSPLHHQLCDSDKKGKDDKQYSTTTKARTNTNLLRHNDDVTSPPSMTITPSSQTPTTNHSWLGLSNDEFPGLNQHGSAATCVNNHQQQAAPVKFSYSAILSGGGKSGGGHYVSKHLYQDAAGVGNHLATAATSATTSNNTNQQVIHSKSKKRIKKAEKATRAANEEYAQISSEQENIKKVLKKKSNGSNGGGGKPSQNLLNLGDLVQRLEQQKITTGGKNAKGDGKTSNRAYENNQRLPMKGGKLASGGKNHRHHLNPHQVANALDSTAPHTKRGKERETPKPKKPSALKKVILKEREEKKEERLKRLLTDQLPNTDVPPFPSLPSHQYEQVDDADDDSRRLPASHNDEDDRKDCEGNDDDDGGGDCESIITTIETTVNFTKLMEDPTTTLSSTLPQIHSRRYREYCCQVLEKDIDEICTAILQKLVFFQDRMYQNDPIKAKSKRRYVLGLREVAKHLKLNRLKCVIISPNLEKIQSKGGLDEAMNRILSLCEQQKVTYVFALGRKAMGCAVGKLVPVSIVGIFDHSGVDDLYRKLVLLVKEAQGKYREMISIYQHDITTKNNENKSATGCVNSTTAGGSSTSSRRFAHMSHSRNPSAASCLSFASYISEPISELNEASNWRILMEAISDPPPLPPPSEEHDGEDSKAGVVTKKVKEEKKEDSSVGAKKTVTTKPMVDCKSSNGTIVESAKHEDDENVDEKNKDEDDEAEVIKNLVKQKPHDLVNSWLQSAAATQQEADFEDIGQSKLNDEDEN